MNNPNNDQNYYDDLINNNKLIDTCNLNSGYQQILQDLQGGMLKNYGRQYSLYIFIQFDAEKINEVKQWIGSEIAPHVTSTLKQLQDTEDYKENCRQNNIDASSTVYGELCQNFFLSYQGYKVLLEEKEVKNSSLFTSSRKQQQDDVSVQDKVGIPSDRDFDQPMNEVWKDSYPFNEEKDWYKDAYWYNHPDKWEIGNAKNPVHALIFLAHDCVEELKDRANTIINEWKQNQLGKILTCEAGYVVREECQPNDKKKPPIGPFGFADGISQPLFFKCDYDQYKDSNDVSQWNPQASLNLVLVKDPLSQNPYSFGSYCVWQKLETNYELFQEKIDELLGELVDDPQKADALTIERANALTIGRFKDGTPLALCDQPNQNEDRDSFNYADDPNGSKCPLHAHMRQVNPRRDNDNKELEKNRKNKRIFRAGITYFDDLTTQQNSQLSILERCFNQLDYLKNKVSHQSLEEQIKNISGLLFVSFQRDIGLQFLELQQAWADDRKFPRTGKEQYLDPIIGHPATKRVQDCPDPQQWPKQWDNDEQVDYSFYGCVKNKGGEFFFAPSISFLKNLLP
ncbi:probable peroxidase [Crocosphaera subtropica ATCC 51142]|uniref:Probable peroxidase n=1 Tax=Crocosphaera subtropica (strain ATCC 51142 / BH68) TaxID=43989 RepID=B1WRK8_CROS5|nr:peroxidase [Crocosphaera subtropica]ACB53449.1 probable peroxidase [Crocosphaera subtropica ATCC 51142]